MKHLALESGLTDGEYSKLYGAVDKIDAIELIKLDQYKKALDVYTLPGTVKLWDYCKLQELTGMVEVRMLNEALVILRIAFRRIINETKSA
jgi:hypothetical protein